MNDEAPDRAEFRAYWRRHWLGMLSQFADLELQRREWLDPKQTNPHWSYIEFKCKYFDDLVLSDGYAFSLQQGLVSEAEVAAIAPLDDRLRKHEAPGGNDWDNAAVLNDPEWHAIAQEARSAIDRLLTLALTPEEKNLLS